MSTGQEKKKCGDCGRLPMVRGIRYCEKCVNTHNLCHDAKITQGLLNSFDSYPSLIISEGTKKTARQRQSLQKITSVVKPWVRR